MTLLFAKRLLLARCWRIFLFLLVVVETSHGRPSTETTKTSKTRRSVTSRPSQQQARDLDLSSLPHISADQLAQAVGDYLARFRAWQKQLDDESSDSENAKAAPLGIDLSDCSLGDAGMDKIADVLLPKNRKSNNDGDYGTSMGQPRVILKAQSNDLTPVSATRLLDRVLLLAKRSSLIQTTTSTTTQSTLRERNETSTIQPSMEESVQANTTTSYDKNVSATSTELTGDNTTTNKTGVAASIQPSSSSSSSSSTASALPPQPWLEELDLGWNPLWVDDHEQGDGEDDSTNLLLTGESQQLLQRLERLVSQPMACPRILKLEQCGLGPAAARSLAKGTIQRFLGRDITTTRKKTKLLPPSVPKTAPTAQSLFLSRNPALGNAGTAAMAAAIRTIVTAVNEEAWAAKVASESNATDNPNSTTDTATKDIPLIFDILDLSACQVGDAGADALALALEDVMTGNDDKYCIRVLDLSNNRITDQGATALGRALAVVPRPDNKQSQQKDQPSTSDTGAGCVIDTLDLSNNPGLGDRGVKALAEAFAQGRIRNLILRSCNIQAGGAALLGTALRVVADTESDKDRSLDLSGNPLGILGGKKKSSDGGGKYSASRLTSTATATAKSYMNMLTKGLKDGLGGVAPTQNEYDDDDGDEEPGMSNNEGDSSQKRCGAKAFANAFLEANEKNVQQRKRASKSKPRLHLGLRHCFFDHAAADALASIVVEAMDNSVANVELDVTMNSILEESMVSALHGEKGFTTMLREMAERHIDVLELIREAEQRAAEARRRAAAAAQAARNRERRPQRDPWEPDMHDDDESDDFGEESDEYDYDDEVYDEESEDNEEGYY